MKEKSDQANVTLSQYDILDTIDDRSKSQPKKTSMHQARI